MSLGASNSKNKVLDSPQVAKMCVYRYVGGMSCKVLFTLSTFP